MAALLREHRMARAYADHRAIASVENAIASLAQDGLDLTARQRIGAASLVTVILAVKDCLRDDVQFGNPAHVWNLGGLSGVATVDWPQLVKQRVLSLVASLDSVLELDGLAA